MTNAIPGIVGRAIEHLQFQVRKLTERLQRDRFLTRRTISNIDVSTSATSVRHALGYVPSGYLVIRKSASVTIHDTGITKDEIELVASGTAVISILVW